MEITETVARKVIEVVDAGLVKGMGSPVAGKMCVEAAVCYAMGLPHGDNPSCVSRPLRALKIRLNDSNWSSNGARAKGLRRLAVAQLGSAGVLGDKEFRRRVVDLAIRKSVPDALKAASSACKDDHKRKAMLDAADRCEKEGTQEAALAGKASAAYAASSAAYASAAYAAYAASSASAAAYAAYAASSAAYASDAAAYAAASSAASASDAAAYAAYAASSAAYASDAAAYAAASYAAYASDAASSAAYARDKSLADYAEAVVQILINMKAPGCQWLFLTEALS